MTNGLSVELECRLGDGESDALAGLVAEAISHVCSLAGVPFTAPLLLFARLDGPVRQKLFADRPGFVLVQEHLFVESRRALRQDEAIHLAAQAPVIPPAGGLIELSARLSTPAGELIAVVRAGLRHVAEEAIMQSTGVPIERIVKGEAMQSLPCGPLSADLVARYARLAGDDNALHRDADAIVPGAFLAALAEPAVAAEGLQLKRISIRFMAPIRAGEAFEIIRQMGRGTAAGRPMRLLYIRADRAVAAIADLLLGGNEEKVAP